MNFFSKKRPSDADRKQQAASKPYVADDQTITRVAELMRMFNDAVGDTDMTLAAGKGICSAVGLSSMKEMWEAKETTAALNRPWEMLAAVALRAAQNGDHILAGRIFGFTWMWGQIASHLAPADFVDVPLLKSPPALEAKIATIALGSLQQLPLHQIIFSNATGTLTAGDLTRVSATVLLEAPEKGVPVDNVIIAAAKSIVG